LRAAAPGAGRTSQARATRPYRRRYAAVSSAKYRSRIPFGTRCRVTPPNPPPTSLAPRARGKAPAPPGNPAPGCSPRTGPVGRRERRSEVPPPAGGPPARGRPPWPAPAGSPAPRGPPAARVSLKVSPGNWPASPRPHPAAPSPPGPGTLARTRRPPPHTPACGPRTPNPRASSSPRYPPPAGPPHPASGGRPGG